MSKVMEVVAPPKVVDLKEMSSMLEDWEAKERELKAETGETIPDRFKMAIITTMTPASVQEWIFQQASDETTYENLRDKILGIAKNRVAMAAAGAPTPVDIGQTKYNG